MRHIVLDTETTGFKPFQGDRLVEIGCIELINHVPSGAAYYHCYLNPERDMPDAAYQVHKLSSVFLADKPLFREVADDFLTFIEDSPLIIHNASFDMGFINAELGRIGRTQLPENRAIDTVAMARRKFPGLSNSLDALCDRFKIDRGKRNHAHGAIIDCELLAEVYLELIGGRQQNLGFDQEGADLAQGQNLDMPIKIDYSARSPVKPYGIEKESLMAHEAMMKKLAIIKAKNMEAAQKDA